MDYFGILFYFSVVHLFYFLLATRIISSIIFLLLDVFFASINIPFCIHRYLVHKLKVFICVYHGDATGSTTFHCLIIIFNIFF